MKPQQNFTALSVLIIVLFTGTFSYAQNNIKKERQTVAIMVPLYLDSAFDAINYYRFGKTFPRFLTPGLEFYEGAQLAIDTLKKLNLPIDVVVYDTKGRGGLQSILREPGFETVDLILGYVSSNEIRPLANAALAKKIPFINVNLPNDAAIQNNVSYIILNSTLRMHCEGIYRFLQKNYATSPIIFFKKDGVQEDKLKQYFTDLDKNTAGVPLKIKYVSLTSDFSVNDIDKHLDSTRQNMCIAGSLDETFALNFCEQLAYLNKTYPVQVMGMPTWDGLRDFHKQEFAGLDIYYTTPFYYPKTDKLSLHILDHFKNSLYSRPTDVVFRGYETTLRYGRLLADFGNKLDSSIGEKKYKVFNDFDIQPVILDKKTQALEYFENRKLYFIKKTDGVVKAVY
jgi:hypothetical protein